MLFKFGTQIQIKTTLIRLLIRLCSVFTSSASLCAPPSVLLYAIKPKEYFDEKKAMAMKKKNRLKLCGTYEMGWFSIVCTVQFEDKWTSCFREFPQEIWIIADVMQTKRSGWSNEMMRLLSCDATTWNNWKIQVVFIWVKIFSLCFP